MLPEYAHQVETAKAQGAFETRRMQQPSRSGIKLLACPLMPSAARARIPACRQIVLPPGGRILFLALAFIATTCGPAFAQYPPAAPTAYWSFDECAGTEVQDSSGNGHMLAMDGNHPAAWSTGILDGCALDTRQGYAHGPHFADLELLDSFTISFWATTDLWVAGWNASIVCQNSCGQPAGGGWVTQWYADGPSGDCAWFFENSDGSPAEYFSNCSGPEWPSFPDEAAPDVAAGEWAHVALRFNDQIGVADVFLNGARVRYGNWTSRTFSNSAELTIGTDHRNNDGTLCGSNHFYQGDIDELLIYDRALTDAEMLKLANPQPPAGGDLLVAEYGTGTDLDCRVLHYDAAGNYVADFASGGDLIHRIGDIAIAPDGLNVFIARPDLPGSGAVLKYTIDGTPLGTVTGLDNLTTGPNGLTFDGVGNMYVALGSSDGVSSASILEHNMATGQNTEIFGVDHPAGVAISPLTGNLFVVSYAGHQVHEFKRVGGVWTEECTISATGLSNPYGVEVADDGKVYVTSYVPSVVIEFENVGGACGWTRIAPDFVDGLEHPNGVVIGPNGNLFVTSYLDPDRVVEFDIPTRTTIANPYTQGAGLTRPVGLAFVPSPAPIPTVSQWGMVVMVLLVLLAGTIVYTRRCPTQA